jgi:hypothetical protein
VAYKHQPTNLIGLSFHIYFSSLVCPSFLAICRCRPISRAQRRRRKPRSRAELCWPSPVPLARRSSQHHEDLHVVKPAIMRTKPPLTPPPLVALHICAALALCRPTTRSLSINLYAAGKTEAEGATRSADAVHVCSHGAAVSSSCLPAIQGENEH